MTSKKWSPLFILFSVVVIISVGHSMVKQIPDESPKVEQVKEGLHEGLDQYQELSEEAVELKKTLPETKQKTSRGKDLGTAIICDKDLYNCGDFKTYSAAQEAFKACGGVAKDIHRLDGDKDGLPCESLI